MQTGTKDAIRNVNTLFQKSEKFTGFKTGKDESIYHVLGQMIRQSVHELVNLLEFGMFGGRDVWIHW